MNDLEREKDAGCRPAVIDKAHIFPSVAVSFQPIAHLRIGCSCTKRFG